MVAALFHSTPLLVKSARAAFESVDRSYERAARNLGASELRLFWRVTLPLARRSILAAAALAFARSLGDFGVTLMIAGNIPGRTQTVAIAIYDAVEAGNGAAARVLVVIVSAVALRHSDAGQPSHHQSLRPAPNGAMIQARIRKQFRAGAESAGFSLDLEFQAAAGITVLFGPSGAGKTLTLDSIAGFVRPDEGRILLDDEILFDGAAGVHLPPRARHCGYVFQNYALFPHMTLRKNLEFAAGTHPAPGAASQGKRDAREISSDRCLRAPPSRAFRRTEAALLHRPRVDRRAASIAARRTGARPGRSAAGRVVFRSAPGPAGIRDSHSFGHARF